jgi:hypothetical protein
LKRTVQPVLFGRPTKTEHIMSCIRWSDVIERLSGGSEDAVSFPQFLNTCLPCLLSWRFAVVVQSLLYAAQFVSWVCCACA